MEYSGAGGKLIHEKNQKQKISWHCPFKQHVFSYQQNLLFKYIANDCKLVRFSVHNTLPNIRIPIENCRDDQPWLKVNKKMDQSWKPVRLVVVYAGPMPGHRWDLPLLKMGTIWPGVVEGYVRRKTNSCSPGLREWRRSTVAHRASGSEDVPTVALRASGSEDVPTVALRASGSEDVPTVAHWASRSEDAPTVVHRASRSEDVSVQ